MNKNLLSDGLIEHVNFYHGPGHMVKNCEKLKHSPVRPLERHKLQPIIYGFRITTNTAQDTWYKIREKMKYDPIRPPERPKL
ncbi:hypothetical protein KSS87_006159 [Heliosperma pusillum]|nr:hypothetical protein KSS87_006159 [Heliosperma pusillum]